ncbi:MAG TPA: heme A synthase [Actinobacteria bacterium]|nr:heme A synthase [Actinomycetota bacterium]
MSTASLRDPIVRWLLLVAGVVGFMVVVGGYVRLSRAGLSIVEWDPITGVLPPLSDAAWRESFAAYQKTPEYRIVNAGMTLAEYRRIFLIEWGHRLLARIAGLAVVVPLVVLMWRRRLGVRASLPYWGLVALFGLQGALGWVMVASGLVDRPAVSHLRLTLHLLVALTILGVALWMALDRLGAAEGGAVDEGLRLGSWLLGGVIVVQIALGGFVAGLKAGHVSSTWPLMFGYLVPPGVWGGAVGWWERLGTPLTAHWTHRWFALVVLAVAVAVAAAYRRQADAPAPARAAATVLAGVVAVQVALGIGVVVYGVPMWLALVHQGTGVVVFALGVVVLHAAVRTRRASPVAVAV